MRGSAWGQTFSSPKNPKSRLICFPPAGGDAALFRDWQKKINLETEVVGIRLPGRGTRFAEAPCDEWEQLLSELELGIQPYLDLPYFFFGHSFGGILAFEIARRLQRKRSDGNLLKLLIISSLESPKNNSKIREAFKALSDEGLVDKLRALGGIPSEVIAHQELMEFIKPVLRADFDLLISYFFQEMEPLSCPMIIMTGQEDSLITRQDLTLWQQQTEQPIDIKVFSGGHFYFQENPQEFFSELVRVLGRYQSEIMPD